jgi:hypothetical protein
LERYCRGEDYKGWDPFDGLNSSLFGALPFSRARLVQLAWLQAFKRLPINFRRVAGVAKTANAKALALFAMAYQLLDQSEQQYAVLSQMLQIRSPAAEWGGGAWGYPFPWRARAFHVARGVPNVICTAYCVQALSEATAARSSDYYDDVILAAAAFVAKHLVRNERGEQYITYVPIADLVVHNANLWGAYILAEASHRGAAPRVKELARAAAQFTLRRQRADGSWVYGERDHHRFIDSFHTGYVICALDRLATLLRTTEFDHAIETALDFYCQAFFNGDGRPAYYIGNRGPIDSHNGAQAVITLLSVRCNEPRRRLAERITRWMLDNMWLPGAGRFGYQRTSIGMNSVPYMRWSQAWMFLALATLARPQRADGLLGSSESCGMSYHDRA